MTFEEYTQLAMRTVNKNQDQKEVLGLVGLGLPEEAGEVTGLIKKHLFHGHALKKDKIIEELGDLLWYMARTAYALNVSLSEVAEGNIAKLNKRYPAGFSIEASINRVV